MFFHSGKTAPNLAIALLGKVDPEAVKFATDMSKFKGYKAGEIRKGAVFSVKSDLARIEWEDGTVLWARKDSAMNALDVRSLELTQGTLFVQVAKSAEPFTIKVPEGAAVQALGTRFEVSALVDKGVRVRVVEGHVRRGSETEARGGEEISAEGKVKAFDPREVLIAWSDVLEPRRKSDTGFGAVFIAPWGQLGGAPGHGGQSPFAGPAGLAAKQFFPFPPAAPGTAEETLQRVPAVAGNNGRVFVPRRAPEFATQLFMLDLSAAQPAWTNCGKAVAGNAQNAAVITPRGQVVMGTTGNQVMAWDPERGETAWSKDLGSSVYALASSHDGLVYCSTLQRLAVLNGEGEQISKFDSFGIQDLQAPVAVAPDNSVLVVSRAGMAVWLARSGDKFQIRKGPIDLQAASEGIYLPPVCLDAGGFAIATNGASDGGGRLLVLDAEGQFKETAKGVSGWPLSTGAYAEGNTLRLADGRSVAMPIKNAISALAQDVQGNVYAAVKGTVYRIPKSYKDGDAVREFAAVKQGEVVRGGIAIAMNRLIVTTTEGVQLFE